MPRELRPQPCTTEHEALALARARIEASLDRNPDWIALKHLGGGGAQFRDGLQRSLAAVPAFQALRKVEEAMAILVAAAVAAEATAGSVPTETAVVALPLTARIPTLQAFEQIATAGLHSTADDDLTRIRGIDAAMMQRLAGLGVTRFAQIAAWWPDEVRGIAEALGLDREITRQSWIAQASLLQRLAPVTAADGVRPAAAAETQQAPAGGQVDAADELQGGLPAEAAACDGNAAASASMLAQPPVRLQPAGDFAPIPFDDDEPVTAEWRMVPPPAVSPVAEIAGFDAAGPEPATDATAATRPDDTAVPVVPAPALPPAAPASAVAVAASIELEEIIQLIRKGADRSIRGAQSIAPGPAASGSWASALERAPGAAPWLLPAPVLVPRPRPFTAMVDPSPQSNSRSSASATPSFPEQPSAAPATSSPPPTFLVAALPSGDRREDAVSRLDRLEAEVEVLTSPPAGSRRRSEAASAPQVAEAPLAPGLSRPSAEGPLAAYRRPANSANATGGPSGEGPDSAIDGGFAVPEADVMIVTRDTAPAALLEPVSPLPLIPQQTGFRRRSRTDEMASEIVTPAFAAAEEASVVIVKRETAERQAGDLAFYVNATPQREGSVRRFIKALTGG